MKKRRTKNRANTPVFLLLTAIGAAAGMGAGWLFAKSPLGFLLTAALMCLGAGVGFFSQVIIHEAGHLLCGLMSGYRFCSFRIGGVMLTRENGRYKIKKYSIAGTGGQCLMAPPPMKGGKVPVILYNLGGPGMNALTGAIIAATGLWLKDTWWTYMLLPMAFVAFALAATNGIPLRTALVDNDGRNAMMLRRDSEAMRAFWIQLQVSAMAHDGLKICNMPEEWFAMPDENGMKNSMVASLGALAANRLMCEQKFEEADRLMARLLIRKNGLVSIHKALLRSDRIFCELIGENRPQRVESLYTAPQQKLMRLLGTDLSVMRTMYAMALMHFRDENAAREILEKFNSTAKNYPFAGEAVTEEALIAIADEKYAQMMTGAEVQE